MGGIASVNPFRYRGYYWDSELTLYYLKTRYYDPSIGRFINADSIKFLGANRDFCAYNLFAYCGNNPVNRIDLTGYLWIGIAALAALLLMSLSTTGCANTASYRPTHVSLDNTYCFDTFESAAQVAINSVHQYSTATAITAGNNVMSYGVESCVDIYYNPNDGLFYITKVYSDNANREVYHRELLGNDGTYVFVGSVHYHPDVGDGSLIFSPADREYAEHYRVVAYIVNYDGDTNVLLDYVINHKYSDVLPKG